MTGLLHEKEFSRKSFIKDGGALIVGFSLGSVGVGRAQAGSSPASVSRGYNPDPRYVDTWLSVHPDNTVSLRSGRVELGQGSATGLLMIAAEELKVGLGQMHFVRNDTHTSPNSGETSASSSISAGWWCGAYRGRERASGAPSLGLEATGGSGGEAVGESPAWSLGTARRWPTVSSLAESCSK